MATRYLKIISLVVLTGLLLTVLFNLLMDPYWIYGTPTVKGINALKTEFHKHDRLIKAHMIRQIRPDALILGSSRARDGIDPRHPGWVSSRVYNAALSDGIIYEMLRYLQHGYAGGPLKQVVLFIDLRDFNIFKSNGADFSEARLAANADGSISSKVENELIPTLASLDAVLASARTLINQSSYRHTKGVHIFLANGLREGTHNSINIRYAGGQRKAFQKSEKRYIKKGGHYFPAPRFQYDFLDSGNSESDLTSFRYFRKIVETSRRENIDLRIVVSPSHARQWEMIRIVGLWPKFEEWKRQLVRILAEDATDHPDERPFPLWDFSGCNSITTEEVPRLDDTETQMQWYWDSAHYKIQLGNLVLDRTFDYHEPGRLVPEDFGVRLGPKNIEQHLARLRKNQAEWEASHADDVMEIKSIADEFGPRRGN